MRFGEVGLKGKNRAYFINGLAANIRRVLKLGPGWSGITYGRVFVTCPRALRQSWCLGPAEVFGLVSFSPRSVTELDMGAIKEAALRELLADGQPETFKVAARRFKTFSLNSMEINQELGHC